MKKNIYIILMIISSTYLYSAEPLVKFYLQDGSTKQYNISDIDSMNILDKRNNYVMRIHYQDTLVAYYPTEIIGSIRFEKDSVTRDILNVYIFSFPKSYILSSIDSVIFYIDQYQPLTIGSQVWMLKNLNVDHYRNGDLIPEIKYPLPWSALETGAWCYYANDTRLEIIFGKLYNWYAVNDTRSLAPTGWHIPSDSEWTELVNYLGGYYVAGVKLKSTEILLGYYHNGNNESGFSALLGGNRGYYGDFDDFGEYGNWWSSSEIDSSTAWYIELNSSGIAIYRSSSTKIDGYSVRCINDK